MKNNEIQGSVIPVERLELPTIVGAVKGEFPFVSIEPRSEKSGELYGLPVIIKKAYKYRIYPNKKQRAFLNQTMGCCRWLWNYALAKINEAENKITKETSDEEKKAIRESVYVNNISKEIPFLKRDQNTAFLKEAISIALGFSLRHLDRARSNYFRDLKNGRIEEKKNRYISNRKKRGLELNKKKLNDIGKPKFKRKGHRESCSFHQSYSIDWERSRLNIPKCSDIRIIFHRKFTGTPKTVTIEKTPSGKYFASILVEEKHIIKEKPKIIPETTVGLHNGITNFVTSDEAIVIKKTNRFLRGSIVRLKVLQRRLSRKEKKSKRWEKQRIAISKLHEKIANQRNYLLHHVASVIIKNPEYQTIAVENWDKELMLKNPIFAQAISDVSWEKLILYIKYRAEWNGKNILELPPVTANAKTCNECGYLNDWVELKDREWECEKCHAIHKREVNCAKNTKKMCLNNLEVK